ncbi:MAG: 30S ribosomal protein S16 [Bdellovibrionota bacterium]
MVIIRLNRGGSKKRPKYRITVADSRRWLGGKFLEVIGNFNPSPRGAEKRLTLDLAKAQEWIAKGAQPTERVQSLMHEAGLPRPAYKEPRLKPKVKAKPAEAPKAE